MMVDRRRGRASRWLGGIVAALVVLAVGFWAGSVVVRPAVTSSPPPVAQLYEVAEGTVGQSLSYSARATWASGPTVSSPADGTLTSIALPDDGVVTSGDVLYTLDLRPTIAVDGDVPVFRDLAAGVSGDDVAQLQRFLLAQGFLTGDADGVFGSATAAAVRDWQRAADMAVDGVVNLGEVVFMALPARAYLAGDVRVGATVGQGDAVLETVVGAPSFVLTPTTDEAVRVATEGLPVIIDVGGSEVVGVTQTSQQLQDGSTVVPVEGQDGAVICGEDCQAAVTIPGPVVLSARLVLAPEQTGPVVPISAIRTDPNGQTQITMGDGASRAVEVLVSYGGLAVVDGIDVGDSVQLFGDE